MKTDQKTAEVLNDLIEINHDRTTGYENAVKDTKPADADLRTLFEGMAAESRSYANDLSKYVTGAGVKPAEGTTIRGKIYRTWMSVKDAFSGKDRKSVLASCEFGEDAAQKAYDEALASDAELPTEVRRLIAEQKSSLKKSHD